MNVQTVEQKVKCIIAEQLGVEENRVIQDADLVTDLGADSLDVVELVMAVEESFGFEISDEESQELRSVKDVINYIEERKK